MSELLKAIEAKEKELGRKLSPIERMAVDPKTPKINPDQDWDLISSETAEGMALMSDYRDRKKAVENVSDVNERHRLAHWLSAEKKKLVKRWKAGELTRLPKKALT